jgi:hypothetical protein
MGECYRSAWFGVEHTEYPDAFFVILFNMYASWLQLKGNIDIHCIEFCFGTKFLIARYTPDAWRMRARPKKV